MADSRHTRTGSAYRTRRTLRSDAFWVASKPAVAREGEIETGTGGPPVANAVRHTRRKLRNISFLLEALEYQIVCEFRNQYREFESTFSATQSVDLAYNLERAERSRERPGFFHSERTGERGTERDSAVLAAILYAPNEVGSLSRLLTATTQLRRSIATYDEKQGSCLNEPAAERLGNGPHLIEAPRAPT